MPTDYTAIEREIERTAITQVENMCRTVLGPMYSERTHFIYELLQNAEDALRRLERDSGVAPLGNVTFRLYSDRLEFQHFGRPFDAKDITSICRVAESTAGDDPGRIGKFGIGFKSVYAYTSSPEIHSGNEHFQIRNYVHPQSAEPVPLQPGETLFILPFNEPKIPKNEAFAEIERFLQNLDSETLLFLHYISEIRWEVEGALKGAYSRDEEERDNYDLITIAASTDGNHSNRAFVVAWGEGDKSVLWKRNAAAFEARIGPKTGDCTIIPRAQSSLCAFFPTKDKTHLKLLVQAPFNTTPTREKIREDDPDNKKLIGELASLVARSLIAFREAGLLTVSLLKALPLREDEFPPGGLFRPIFDKVRDTLLEEQLLPAHDGTYVNAQEARIPRSSELRELLSTDQLRQLWNSQNRLEWLSKEITPAGETEDLYNYLTRHLKIPVTDPDMFASLLNEKFMANQTDEWVSHLYAFLVEVPSLWKRGTTSWQPLLRKPFIRLADGQHVVPFGPDQVPNAYLPPRGQSEFPIVKREIDEDERAHGFLQELGLKEPDVVAEVLKLVIPRYEHQESVSLAHHKSDIGKILSAWGMASGKDKEVLRSKVCDLAFLVATDLAAAKSEHRKASDVYLRTPEIESYFKGCSEEVWFLDEDLSEEEEKVAKDIGVASVPRLLQFSPEMKYTELEAIRKAKHTSYGTNFTSHELTDYRLHGLNDCMNRLSQLPQPDAAALSHTIWGFLRQIVTERTEWSFQRKYRWKYYSWFEDYRPPQFIARLQTSYWLPDKIGRLADPKDLSLDDLMEGFEKDETLARVLSMKPRALKVLCEQSGIEEDLLNLLRDPEAVAMLKRYKSQARAKEAALTRDDGGANATPTDEEGESSKQKKTGKSDAGGRTSKQVRLETRVYVTPAGDEGSSTRSQGDVDEQDSVAKAGVQKVLEHERRAGRMPKEMPNNNPGFDIIESISSSGEKRYIEVKSMHGDWGERGVGLTPEQFITAQQKGESFWLYVVERADEENAAIYPIQDPAHIIEQFMFDHGWKDLSTPDNGKTEASESAPSTSP